MENNISNASREVLLEQWNQHQKWIDDLLDRVSKLAHRVQTLEQDRQIMREDIDYLRSLHSPRGNR